MKKFRTAKSMILLLVLFSGSFVVTPAGARTTYAPTEVEASKLSLEQAADNVQRAFIGCRQGIATTVQVLPDIVKVSWSDGYFEMWQFRELHDISLTYVGESFWMGTPASLAVSAKGHFLLQDGVDHPDISQECLLDEAWTKVLGDSLLRLKMEYDKTNSAETAALCVAEAVRYRALDPKPDLPEDARRFRVQAEAALASKRFLDAAAGYQKGILIAPWWPEGHYNRAVILAELQNFDSAIAEMKCYLQLKPDALDARQAQDSIYVWEARPFEAK